MKTSAASAHFSFKKFLFYIVITVAAILLLARFVGSPLLTEEVNKKLAALPGFTGRVETVTLALWRSDVSVANFQLSARDQPNECPLLKLKHGALKFSWIALLKGKLGGRANLDGVEMNLLTQQAAEGAKKAGQKVKEKEEEHGRPNSNNAEIQQWQTELRNAFPVELTQFEVKNSRIRFLDRSNEPNPEIVFDHVHFVVTDFSNRARDGSEPTAKIALDADITGNGTLHLDVDAQPVAENAKFSAKMEVKNINLVAWNNFMLAYLKVKIESGLFDVYIQVSADKGHYQGYTKPFLRDLKFTDAPEKEKSPLERVATKAASAVSSLLKNREGKVATKAPFEGNFDDNKVGIWTTISNLLHNAFVQSLKEGLEGSGSKGGSESGDKSKA